MVPQENAMPPLVSITMSAFNVEPYLRESLECIVNQTLTDIEIICTNDGSTDGTLGILEEFALLLMAVGKWERSKATRTLTTPGIENRCTPSAL